MDPAMFRGSDGAVERERSEDSKRAKTIGSTIGSMMARPVYLERAEPLLASTSAGQLADARHEKVKAFDVRVVVGLWSGCGREGG